MQIKYTASLSFVSSHTNFSLPKFPLTRCILASHSVLFKALGYTLSVHGKIEAFNWDQLSMHNYTYGVNHYMCMNEHADWCELVLSEGNITVTEEQKRFLV